MTKFSFTVIVEGADILDARAQEALFEAGCDDAMFSSSAGVQVGVFDREAPTFADAVCSAIKCVESAVPGSRVIEVHREPESTTGG